MRVEILEHYPLACCRPADQAFAVHLDVADPEPFAQGDTEELAWAAAWSRLQNLPDD